MWPGRARSCGRAPGSISVPTVCARSAAEMPVVVPLRASTEIVNAVPMGSDSPGAISGRFSSWSRAASSGTQMIPEQCLTMKAMLCGVAFSAAMMRSPSFSRFSSSTTMTMPPARRSSSAASMASKPMPGPFRPRVGPREPLDIFSDEIDLDVDCRTTLQLIESRLAQGVRDEGNLKGLYSRLHHGQRDAVEGNRPLLDDVAKERRLRAKPHPEGAVLGLDPSDACHPVDVPLDQVAA